jgi:hypothetical protein
MVGQVIAKRAAELCIALLLLHRHRLLLLRHGRLLLLLLLLHCRSLLLLLLHCRSLLLLRCPAAPDTVTGGTDCGVNAGPPLPAVARAGVAAAAAAAALVVPCMTSIFRITNDAWSGCGLRIMCPACMQSITACYGFS